MRHDAHRIATGACTHASHDAHTYMWRPTACDPHATACTFFYAIRRPAPFFRARLSIAHVHTRIVDVGGKPMVTRRASATGRIALHADTLDAIRDRHVPKGDVLTVAEVAALQAVKHTSDWLPLCHPLPITSANVEWQFADDGLACTVTVGTTYTTGVEMEALTGVSAALLTVWDMVKGLEKDDDGQYPDTRIQDIRVVHKHKEHTDTNRTGTA